MRRVPTPVLVVFVLGLLTLLASVGVVGVFLTQRATERRILATQEMTSAVQRATNDRIVAAFYKASIDRWHQSQYGCGRSVDDRRLTLRVTKATLRATHVVASDPALSERTRVARLTEAQALRRQIRGLRLRVPPQFSCARAYPKPKAPPGVKPLR
jgi:hypothetical protein